MNCVTCNQPLSKEQMMQLVTLRLILKQIDWDTAENNKIMYSSLAPEGMTITVLDVHTENEYDSFGNIVTDTTVVFNVRMNDISKNFKITGSGDSYGSDTSWDTYSLIEVSRTPKTVMIWEEV